ncbi:MAG TPA: hypothetical protein VN816_04025 [Acidimicrobiales bacterium]|nr:hypothetical protein [Acidimicrobiales bacterium]
MAQSRRVKWISVVVAAVVASLSTGGTLAWAQSPMNGSVHPRQFFVGTVNGLPADAVITVVCPGAADTGHALPGQTLEVDEVGGTGAIPGFTGTKAKEIVATLAYAKSVTGSLATFRRYGVAASFPTSLVLPCSGTGVVIFDPIPGSPTARAYEVGVTFENIGV